MNRTPMRPQTAQITVHISWVKLDRHQRLSRALWPAAIGAFAQHRQLRACQRHRTPVRLRPHEASPFQALGQQAQDVFIMPLFTI